MRAVSAYHQPPADKQQPKRRMIATNRRHPRKQTASSPTTARTKTGCEMRMTSFYSIEISTYQKPQPIRTQDLSRLMHRICTQRERKIWSKRRKQIWVEFFRKSSGRVRKDRRVIRVFSHKQTLSKQFAPGMISQENTYFVSQNVILYPCDKQGSLQSGIRLFSRK